MRLIRSLIASRKIRFGLVGLGNTLLNFAILNFAFFVLMQGKIISSVIATLCAVCMSFFLNRNFVFRHKGRSLRQPLMFAAVTLTGVLLVQNAVYILFIAVLHTHTQILVDVTYATLGLALTNDFFDINISNFLASLVVMVWNYNGYRLFVFNLRYDHKNNEESENEEVVTLTT